MKVQFWQFVLVGALCACPPSWVSGQTFGSIRLSEILAQHPRIQSFDLESRRFVNGTTGTARREELEQEKNRLLKQLEGLGERKRELKSRLGKALGGTPAEKKTAETAFWKDSQELDQVIESLKNQVNQIGSSLEFGGQTLETTVLPEVSRISADVLRIAHEAASRQGVVVLFNEAVPRPTGREPEVLTNQWKSMLATGEMNQSREALQAWVKNRHHATVKLAGKLRLLRPVLIGGPDLTDEVVKSMNAGGTKAGGK